MFPRHHKGSWFSSFVIFFVYILAALAVADFTSELYVVNDTNTYFTYTKILTSLLLFCIQRSITEIDRALIDRLYNLTCIH